VADLAEAVCAALELTAEATEEVRLAAALHDVGKVAIGAEILEKAGPLDEDEWSIMRQHATIGEQAIAPALPTVARLVGATHERFDGCGYPRGLAGDEIPLGARIIAACDAYDAMVSDRSYRSALPAEVALAELGRCAGRQFDPLVVTALRHALDRSHAGTPY
jgi:HD-GYP domain-containing protein (c-di-GMP phosphodiesterase class II)